MMDKQFKIYSVNFNVFYTEEEKEIASKKQDIIKKMTKIENYYKFKDKYKIEISNKEYEEKIELVKLGDEITKKWFKNALEKNEEENKKWFDELNKMTKVEKNRALEHKRKKELKQAKKLAKNDLEYIDLKERKKDNIKNFNKILKSNSLLKRSLNVESLKEEDVISVFSNAFSRATEIQDGSFTDGIICITISHYQIMNQLIENKFTWNNNSYRFFTSSAGQIRDKKCVFIREDIWDKYSKTLMCGLSLEVINAKGGMNVNKFLSYLALYNSGTEVLKGFDIDRAIVVDDFSTTLTKRKVDYIDRNTLDITVGKEMDITIEHSDGCGMILDGDKSFQIRLPWVKGLMTPVDYIGWIDIYKTEIDESERYKTKDIYNKEWDLKKDNIKYIFSKSQFKMWKYYDSWDEYKQAFKDNNCKANYTNKEENKNDFKKGRFNYQYWQTITDIKDEEIYNFTYPIAKRIHRAYIDIDEMLDILGVGKRNKNMNIEQQILSVYPELLKDAHYNKSLADKIATLKKDAKSGKFVVNSINTFLIPDVFAWCQYLFLGKDKVTGLLKDGEVSCKYFKEDKLLLDRSPHLWKEHAIRKNVVNDDTEKWFKTNGVYTSCHDVISKILMFDNDGDHASVCSDRILIDIIERNLKGVLPLYYEMGVAGAEQINEKSICKSMQSAFKYGNIGQYSNKITRLWNSDKIEDKTLELIKILTALNNFSIDSAKTLDMPYFGSRQDERKLIKEAEELGLEYVMPKNYNYKKDEYANLLKIANGKVPYFFHFAKDKPKDSCADRNESTVNRICKNIESINTNNDRYDFSSLTRIYKRYLCSSKFKEIDLTAETSISLCILYNELDKTKNTLFRNAKNNSHEENEVATNIYDICNKKFDEYLKEKNITRLIASDILVKYIFTDINHKNGKKTLLLQCFGDIILENLNTHLGGTMICESCKKRTKKTSNRQKFCPSCEHEEIKKKDNERKNKKKVS